MLGGVLFSCGDCPSMCRLSFLSFFSFSVCRIAVPTTAVLNEPRTEVLGVNPVFSSGWFFSRGTRGEEKRQRRGRERNATNSLVPQKGRSSPILHTGSFLLVSFVARSRVDG